jgi:hypothetical protein
MDFQAPAGCYFFTRLIRSVSLASISDSEHFYKGFKKMILRFPKRTDQWLGAFSVRIHDGREY